MAKKSSDDMGKRQAEAHPASPRPATPQAEAWADRDEVEEVERQSRSDAQSGQQGIDEKGIDAPADDAERRLHAKPLTDNG